MKFPISNNGRENLKIGHKLDRRFSVRLKKGRCLIHVCEKRTQRRVYPSVCIHATATYSKLSALMSGHVTHVSFPRSTIKTVLRNPSRKIISVHHLCMSFMHYVIIEPNPGWPSLTAVPVWDHLWPRRATFFLPRMDHLFSTLYGDLRPPEIFGWWPPCRATWRRPGC